MIGEGKFSADINLGWEVLAEYGLTACRNPHPAQGKGVTSRLRDAATYKELYNGYIAMQAFDILLDDGALFFFRREPEESTQLSYGYLESPYDVLPYSAFLREYFNVDSDGSSIEAWSEYEEFCSQAEAKPHVVPFRYDWSPSLYREGIHPAGHLHAGHNTEVRLAVDTILSPAQFITFVVRQFYVTQWERMLDGCEAVHRIASSATEFLVEQKFRQGNDLLELRMLAPTPSKTFAARTAKLTKKGDGERR